jgi:deoxyribodipyrimidine photo-lyase
MPWPSALPHATSAGAMIHAERLEDLNDAPERQDARYVLYWMQQAQRVATNHALEFALERANALGLPLVVGFGLMDGYPEANRRHYAFMLEGLAEAAADLEDRGIRFVVRHGSPEKVALDLAGEAALVVCDRGYLRHQRAWRRTVADGAPCRVVQVESDVVVPVELASQKAEFGARTIRPKIERVRDDFLVALDARPAAHPSLELAIESDFDVREPLATLDRLKLDESVDKVDRFKGGAGEARLRLERFIEDKLAGYAEGRNEPVARQCSELSPYLHFGQIAPLDLALAAKDAKGVGQEDRASFLEELIVRRELAVNFVTYTEDYDRFGMLPDWAQKTMREHAEDERAHTYSGRQLAAGETHDPYWNAAMREMRVSGYMHNYMRMYWGKKIIEWSSSHETAFKTTLALNNRYFLDGRDPASYANVGWLFGLHDRAWTERPVFGKLRYMNDKGLKRKFDIQAYVDWTESL